MLYIVHLNVMKNTIYTEIREDERLVARRERIGHKASDRKDGEGVCFKEMALSVLFVDQPIKW